MNTFDELREAAKARFEDTLRKIDEAQSLVSDIARSNGLAPTPALTTLPAAKKTRGRPRKESAPRKPAAEKPPRAGKIGCMEAMKEWIRKHSGNFTAAVMKASLEKSHPGAKMDAIYPNLTALVEKGVLSSQGEGRERVYQRLDSYSQNEPAAPMPMVLNKPMNRVHGSALKQGMREALKTLDGEFNREDLRAAVLKVAPAALEHERPGAFASTLAELRESCEIELVGRPSPESPAVYKRGITKEGR